MMTHTKSGARSQQAGLSPEEIEDMVAKRNALRFAGARLRITVAHGVEELRTAQPLPVTSHQPPVTPPLGRLGRWMICMASVAIALFVVVAIWGERMPFEFVSTALIPVMLAAVVTALVLLALVVVRDCRARKQGGAL